MRIMSFRFPYAGALALLLLFGMVPLALQAPPRAELPAKPRELVETAIQNWNQVYGTHVKALDWAYEGTIASEEQREVILGEMTAPEKAWFPSGDVGRPSEMTALRIVDDPQIERGAIEKWQAMVRGKVRVGHHIVRIRWIKGSQPFTSICIADDNALVYDSMLFNAVLTQKHSRCFEYKMWWIWEKLAGKPWQEWTRGHITADLTPNCREGTPVTCDKDCQASMTGGEATIKCKTRIVQNCCQMDYNWAWACGFKKIKVGKDKFSLEVEGYIGSSGAGNGSCTECCPAPPPKAPPPPPPPGKPTPTPGSSKTTDEGTHQSTVFDTPYGQVKVNLPKEQSDTLTGTVEAEPRDQTASDVLQGMVVDVEGKTRETVSVAKGVLAVTGAGSVVALVLRSTDGREIARQNVEFGPVPQPVRDFALPGFGQPGQTVVVNGPHSGLHENDTLLVGKDAATFVTESKTGSVWRLPNDVNAGQTTIQFQEGTERRDGQFNVVTVQLSAPTTTLPRGGSTEVVTTVSGLEGYDLDKHPLYLREEIRTPGVVKFEGVKAADVLTRQITRDKVKDGQFRIRARVRAKRAGSFQIVGRVTEQEK